MGKRAIYTVVPTMPHTFGPNPPPNYFYTPPNAVFVHGSFIAETDPPRDPPPRGDHELTFEVDAIDLLEYGVGVWERFDKWTVVPPSYPELFDGAHAIPTDYTQGPFSILGPAPIIGKRADDSLPIDVQEGTNGMTAI